MIEKIKVVEERLIARPEKVPVTKYKTSDDKIFDSELHAKYHQREIDELQFLSQLPFIVDSNGDTWYFIKNQTVFTKVWEFFSFNPSWDYVTITPQLPGFFKWWLEPNNNGRDYWKMETLSLGKLKEFLKLAKENT